MSHLLVMSNFPDRASAERAARRLVTDRLAACVNIGATLTSLYHWQGRIETAEETPLVAKTRADLYANVEAALLDEHPYELPEIVAVPFTAGLAKYFNWIDLETQGSHDRRSA